ncbi:MAG: dihydroorotase [Burkholderiales bacterium]|nr:dihydroorotase [Burkholderiales bacterium]
MNRSLIIQNARLVHTFGDNPHTDAHSSTLYIADGKIVGIDQAPEGFSQNAQIIDAQNKHTSFALADLAVRLSEKGGNQDDVMPQVLQAALRGGVAHVACLPDSNPVLDEPRLVTQLIHQSESLGLAKIHPLGALTQGLKGEQLAEMATLVENGCIALSQADQPIRNTQVLQRALAYAASFDVPVWLRAQDSFLSSGFAASGAYASRLGLSGIPTAAESIALFTLFELLRGLGKNAPRVHICRISSARSVELVRAAKTEGLNITCDVNMHHLHLIDSDMGWFNAQLVFNPPLRSSADRSALRAAVLDGTIDVVVSDHTAVNADAKHLPVGQTQAGAIGVQWLLNSLLHLASEEKADIAQVLSNCVANAYAVLGLTNPTWTIGAPANLVIFDTEPYQKIDTSYISGSHLNTPWLNYELAGKIQTVVHFGKLID